MANQDIQSKFLSELADAKVPVHVFLVSGIKLCGIIVGFDQFAIHLQNDGSRQMIYKHAVSTIMPAKDKK